MVKTWLSNARETRPGPGAKIPRALWAKNRSNIVTNSIKIKKKILIASFHNLEHFSASENKHMDMHWQTAVTASAGEASANGAGLPECRLFAPLCVGQKFLVVTK